MNTYLDSFRLLKKSIRENDFYILLCALVAVVLFILTIIIAFSINKNSKDWKKEKNPKFSSFLCYALKHIYTLFITSISIFPLLGMLGTVIGLLGLDLTTGDMENIRANFFIALTSTAWGIIFSVIFKVLHALIADYTEEKIELAKKLTDRIE
ncbi:MAG: MotA/TolQ/ExbB proton channel family protein [Ruminococcus sp.]|nr:MotA/TolQ/ExbB proton channel family protein [Ruminococcus sp.]